MVKNPEFDSVDNLDVTLSRLLRQVTTAVTKIRQKELRKYRISIAEAKVLQTVGRSHEVITPAEISRQLIEEPHSISQLLDRMETRELLKKVKDLPRKNLIRVILTNKGQEKYYQVLKAESIASTISVLSISEKTDDRLPGKAEVSAFFANFKSRSGRNCSCEIWYAIFIGLCLVFIDCSFHILSSNKQ